MRPVQGRVGRHGHFSPSISFIHFPHWQAFIFFDCRVWAGNLPLVIFFQSKNRGFDYMQISAQNICFSLTSLIVHSEKNILISPYASVGRICSSLPSHGKIHCAALPLSMSPSVSLSMSPSVSSRSRFAPAPSPPSQTGLLFRCTHPQMSLASFRT